MLTEAGLGVVMGNAPENIKMMADVTIKIGNFDNIFLQ